ncbi:hypothetical protein EBR25_03570 [bacterium]|nr:hypothetical protein [bacterium]
MKIGSPIRKVILFSTLGGLLCGIHLTLYFLRDFAPWMLFNFLIGVLCLWAALLVGSAPKCNISDTSGTDEPS